MDIYFIRHGMTAGNKLRRYIGRTDEPLSPEGADLAQSRGSFPHIARVWVTPLLRTQQTAKILFPNARQTMIDGLREMDFGDFENRSASEMENDAVYRDWVNGNCLDRCPGGERIDEFSARVCAAFIDALRQESAGQPAVFVVHGGTIMSIMYAFATERRAYYDWNVKNCCGWRAQLSWNGNLPVLSDCVPLDTLKF